MRRARIERATAETEIELALDLDGPVNAEVDTGLGFLDHLMQAFAKHGRFDLALRARGDLETGPHHLVEDVGITLGMALDKALGQRQGIERYGDAIVPMDEALVHAVLDLSGRAYLGFFPERLDIRGEAGGMNAFHLREFLRGLSQHGRLTLHLRVIEGVEAHHVLEASVKALARALYKATRVTREDLPSTKEVL